MASKSKTFRCTTQAVLLPANSEIECILCLTSINDVINLGEKYSLNNLNVHHFCVLFSIDIEQRGNDNQGLLGFLYKDIQRLIDKSFLKICIYCKSGGASIQCRTCYINFHRPCGLVNKCSFQFKDDYNSYCLTHRPKQVIPYDVIEYNSIHKPTCVICLMNVNIFHTFKSIWAPCCNKTWYHYECLQKLASSQGLLFKCAVCSNKKIFNAWVVKFGIHIPHRDASWELEPHAFQSHYLTAQCSAEHCMCPEGKMNHAENGIWKMLICKICGSQGAHRQCLNLKPSTTEWQCLECEQTLNSITKEGYRESPPQEILSTPNDDRQEITSQGSLSHSLVDNEENVLHENLSTSLDSHERIAQESFNTNDAIGVAHGNIPQISLRTSLVDKQEIIRQKTPMVANHERIAQERLNTNVDNPGLALGNIPQNSISWVDNQEIRLQEKTSMIAKQESLHTKDDNLQLDIPMPMRRRSGRNHPSSSASAIRTTLQRKRVHAKVHMHDITISINQPD